MFLRKRRKLIKLTSGISCINNHDYTQRVVHNQPYKHSVGTKGSSSNLRSNATMVFLSLSSKSITLSVRISPLRYQCQLLSTSTSSGAFTSIGDRRIYQADAPRLASIPSTHGSILHVLHLFHLLDSSRHCIGNSDDQFIEIRQATDEGITCNISVHALLYMY